MLKTVVLVAALLAVEVKAFPPGIYFTERVGNYPNYYTYLKYWDPYSANSTKHQVTSGRMRAPEIPQGTYENISFVINARMRSVADLSAYFGQVTSLVTVRETVYILGGNYTLNSGQSSYASIVAISLLDNELRVVVTQLHDEGNTHLIYLPN